MIHKADLPILEFDEAVTATFNPTHGFDHPLGSHKLIITFFPEVMATLQAQQAIVQTDHRR